MAVFTTTSLARMKEYVERARDKMASLREKTEGIIDTGIAAAEVSGTAFAFGYANARWGENGELKVGGLPVDLGAAVALHGIAFMGGLGKHAEHGHNVGTGALASYTYRLGTQLGAEAKTVAERGDAKQLGSGDAKKTAYIPGGQQYATAGEPGGVLNAVHYTVHDGAE